jgi:hypothetical protein
MKSYLIGALIALAAVLISGCDIREDTIEKTEQQGTWKVEKLFTVDGCSVYRFYDRREVYFSNCPGQAQYEYRSNKTTKHMHATTSNQ